MVEKSILKICFSVVLLFIIGAYAKDAKKNEDEKGFK